MATAKGVINRQAYHQAAFTNDGARSEASTNQPWHPGPPPDLDPQAEYQQETMLEPPWWVVLLLRTLPPILHTLRGVV